MSVSSEKKKKRKKKTIERKLKQRYSLTSSGFFLTVPEFKGIRKNWFTGNVFQTESIVPLETMDAQRFTISSYIYRDGLSDNNLSQFQ